MGRQVFVKSKHFLYCSTSLWNRKIKDFTQNLFFTEKHPFRFAQNIDQIYIQVMAGSSEETALFHSIYSRGFVHKSTAHNRQDDLLKALLIHLFPCNSRSQAQEKIILTLVRYLYRGTICSERSILTACCRRDQNLQD